MQDLDLAWKGINEDCPGLSSRHQLPNFYVKTEVTWSVTEVCHHSYSCWQFCQLNAAIFAILCTITLLFQQGREKIHQGNCTNVYNTRNSASCHNVRQ